MIKIEIKTIYGGVAFSWESEKNTVKETVKELLRIKKGETIKDVNLSYYDLSEVDFSNSRFYNSRFYNSSFDNSSFDNSRFYNSRFDNSSFDNSSFDNSSFYNSRFYNSSFYNSSFYNSSFDNSSFDNSSFDNSRFDNSRFDSETAKNLKNSIALDAIKFDFFGRMLVLKNEVAFLKQALIDGRVKGSSYEGDCACFMGTAANAKKCDWKELEGIKPDAFSNTEKWFLGIKEGDTPENSVIAQITLDWIEEFQLRIQK